VVIVTHRSRAEARTILQLAGLTLSTSVAGIVAAEDILNAALRLGKPWQLLRRGLCKSWSLSVVEKRYGIARSKFAFVDDKIENLTDMLDHGVGLALHAPSSFAPDGSSLVSFDFEQIDHALEQWGGAAPVRGIVPMPSSNRERRDWRHTGLNTQRQSRHPFNLVRLCARIARRTLVSG
jgi:hypothetical protein